MTDTIFAMQSILLYRSLCINYNIYIYSNILLSWNIIEPASPVSVNRHAILYTIMHPKKRIIDDKFLLKISYRVNN